MKFIGNAEKGIFFPLLEDIDIGSATGGMWYSTSETGITTTPAEWYLLAHDESFGLSVSDDVMWEHGYVFDGSNVRFTIDKAFDSPGKYRITTSVRKEAIRYGTAFDTANVPVAVYCNGSVTFPVAYDPTKGQVWNFNHRDLIDGVTVYGEIPVSPVQINPALLVQSFFTGQALRRNRT